MIVDDVKVGKMYFDYASDGTEQQRGWMICDRGCRRYRHCHNYEDRLNMVTEMVVWFLADDPSFGLEHESHLGYEPSRAEVSALKPRVTLEDF